MTHQELLFQYVLRLADDALIMGHRLGEWCSKAPILEEDLALTNMALDNIGRAEALLQYAAQIEGKGRTENDLAYKRDERHFYNHLLCEQPNGNFADTMLRQFLLACFEYELYSKLINSQDTQLAAIAAKTIKEVKYHKQHARDWCLRLGDGTEESHALMQSALDQLWMYTAELFEKDELIDMLSTAGVAVDVSTLESAWTLEVLDTLNAAKLNRPQNGYMQTGSRLGIHSEHLGYILAEMQYLPRAYPDAQW